MPDKRSVGYIDLVWLLEMTHEQYLNRFRGSALRRAKHWMLQRNAAVALGNVGDENALPALSRALRSNPHPVVRGHAAWAIGQIGCRRPSSLATQMLSAALVTEEDESVLNEVQQALRDLNMPL